MPILLFFVSEMQLAAIAESMPRFPGIDVRARLLQERVLRRLPRWKDLSIPIELTCGFLTDSFFALPSP